MYISRVQIDTHNRQKMRELSHVGAYHNWVERSFPEEFETKERTRKLWRIDVLQGQEYLLIVSENKPKTHSLEEYGIEGSAQIKNYDPFLQELKEGNSYRFRITLNPVVARKVEGQERGVVMPHVTVEQQCQYLLERAEKNGFVLREDQFSIIERGYIPYQKNGQKTIRLSKVTYEGVLEISDAQQFKKTLTEGFGKKKAYGFGMMTIIPLM